MGGFAQSLFGRDGVLEVALPQAGGALSLFVRLGRGSNFGGGRTSSEGGGGGGLTPLKTNPPPK